MPLKLRFEAYGPPRPEAPPLPPVGMRLQEYVLAYDEGRKRTVYIVAHDHGAAFGDAWLFDGKAWTKVAEGKTAFDTTQKLGAFYDEARAGIATWNFRFDHEKRRHVATSLLFDVRNGLSPISWRGDDPIAEPEGEDTTGTFDYMGLFAPDPKRAVTVCLTRRGVWELDADAIWRKRASLDASFPTEWDDDGAGSAFDPVRERAVFWFFTREPEYEYAFYAWNGRALERMSVEGLPMKKLYMGLFNPAALIASHPVHGLVLVAGSQAFAFDGARWNELPAPRGEAPPRMKNGRMVWDGNLRGLLVGPGYHEGDPGGQEQQRVFFVERDGTWERWGTRTVPSKVKELWAQGRHVHVGGVWYAVATADLQTLRWTETGFEEIVSKKSGEAILGGDRIEVLVDAGGRALAITSHGAVHELADGTWKQLRGAYKAFGERHDFCAIWDPSDARLVVWGGTVKNRASNDTFFVEDGAWKKPKKPSPLPRDKRGRDDPYVDFLLAYDTKIDRVVRFGLEDVAMLDGDDWTPVSPKQYKKVCGARAWEHLPVHDPKTGETLLVNLARGAIARFDLAGCADVAEIELPEELAPKRQHDSPAYVAIQDALSFDATTRTLHAQHPNDASHRYALDLGPAFEAARALGGRKVPAARTLEIAAVGARLYHPKKRVFWFASGNVAETGALGDSKSRVEKLADPAAAIAAKRKAGFVPAEKLPLAVLAEIGARESRALLVGKKTKSAKLAISRIGGAPSGVEAKKWPKGMGFLLQLDGRGVLEKHAGVAVFCTTDGAATEDESNNAAVLLTAAQWKKKPTAAPDGVPALPVRPITAQPARAEIDEDRVRVLSEADPAMAAAFERFQKRAKVQTQTASKIGGAPQFLQATEMRGKYKFFAQVDFDEVGDQGWGLSGCVYVFVQPEEKDAVAFWQFT